MSTLCMQKTQQERPSFSDVNQVFQEEFPNSPSAVATSGPMSISGTWQRTRSYSSSTIAGAGSSASESESESPDSKAMVMLMHKKSAPDANSRYETLNV